MNRRDFGEKAAMALAALSASGCASVAEAHNSSVTGIRGNFEEICWNTVELGASDISEFATFSGGAGQFKNLYRGHSNGDWYDRMQVRLEEAVQSVGDPTDLAHSDFLYYYKNFYSCARAAGARAAHLAAKPTAKSCTDPGNCCPAGIKRNQSPYSAQNPLLIYPCDFTQAMIDVKNVITYKLRRAGVAEGEEADLLQMCSSS